MPKQRRQGCFSRHEHGSAVRTRRRKGRRRHARQGEPNPMESTEGFAPMKLVRMPGKTALILHGGECRSCRGQPITPGGGGGGGRVFSDVSQAALIGNGVSGSQFLPCLETIVITGFLLKTEKTLISQGFLAVFIDISCIVWYNILATEITHTEVYRYGPS